MKMNGLSARGIFATVRDAPPLQSEGGLGIQLGVWKNGPELGSPLQEWAYDAPNVPVPVSARGVTFGAVHDLERYSAGLYEVHYDRVKGGEADVD